MFATSGTEFNFISLYVMATYKKKKAKQTKVYFEKDFQAYSRKGVVFLFAFSMQTIFYLL